MKVKEGASSEAIQMHKPVDTLGCIFLKPGAILLSLLALFSLSIAWHNSSLNSEVDFYQFWAVGQSTGHPNIINIYSDEARESLGAEFLEKAKASTNPGQLVVAEYRKKLETYSSPFLYALFGLFSTGDYEIDFRNYRLLMLAALLFGVGSLCRLLRYTWITTLAAIAIFTAWFQPVSSDLRVGNVNSLQLAALALYLWVAMKVPWNHREALGGVIIGLLLAFKPNLIFIPAMLGMHWIFSGQFRRLWLHALGGAIGAIAAILFSMASFTNTHCWADWIYALRLMPDEIITVDLGNFSAVQFLNGLLGQNTATLLAITFIGSTIVLSWNRTRGLPGNIEFMPAREEFPEIFAISIGCLLIVLTMRLAWLHYYELTIPAFLLLLQTQATPVFGLRSILCRMLTTMALTALVPMFLVYLGVPVSAQAQGALTVCAAVFLFLALAIFPRHVKID